MVNRVWWDYVYKHLGSQDANFVASMRRGFPLVGEIERSHLWSPFFPPAHPFFDQRELPLRALALRQRGIEKVQRSTKAVNFQKHGKDLWDATLLDVSKQVCVGPFRTEDEVTSFLGTLAWIPMPKFTVRQGCKTCR